MPTEIQVQPPEHPQHWQPKHSVRDYLPLIVILLVALLTAFARAHATGDGQTFMREFMGISLVILAMFKLFDLPGFANGFQKYDLVAKRFRPYALIYPFIELALGLAYQANLYPTLTSWILLVVMLVGAAGVFYALSQGLDVACACLGTVLKVPLSTVAVVEDVGMAVMAAVSLVSQAS